MVIIFTAPAKTFGRAIVLTIESGTPPRVGERVEFTRGGEAWEGSVDRVRWVYQIPTSFVVVELDSIRSVVPTKASDP